MTRKNKQGLWPSAIIVLALVALLISQYQQPPEKKVTWRPIPLPRLDQSPVTLRVVYAENPRFNGLTDAQLSRVLAKTRQLARQHLQLELALELQPRISVKQLFHYLPAKVKQARHSAILTWKHIGTAEREAIHQSIYNSLKAYEDHPREAIDYARPYLLDAGDIHNLSQLVDAITQTYITRFEYWTRQQGRDGKPLLNGEYNEWVWWDSLGYGALPYDVVITNQPVISMENYDLSMHTSLRGGVTLGTMTYNRDSPYFGYIFASSYIFNNPLSEPHLYHNAAHFTAEEAIDYTAVIVTHELGHLLYHYGHPFNAVSCIMNPTPTISYREQYQQLDAAACRALNLPSMQAGAETIPYNTAW